MTFVQHCSEQGAVALPTLSKIKDKVLKLQNYAINMGLAQGLGRAFALFTNVLRHLYVENSGATDEMLAIMLTGLLRQQQFKALTCKKSNLDAYSTDVIVELLLRPFPFNLDELRIINCRVKPVIIQKLLKPIPDTKLRRLALVGAGIDTNTFSHILDLLTKSGTLIELDISWNLLGPEDLKRLFALLAENRKLICLNVSWNNIQQYEPNNPTALKE